MKFRSWISPVEFGPTGAVRLFARNTDGCIGKQAVPIPVDELDGDILQRDDEVEADAPILQAQEITEPDLVRRVGEPCHVDEFRVVVQFPLEADVEDSWQLALADGGELGISPGRVENENLLVIVLGPGDTSRERAPGRKMAISDQPSSRTDVDGGSVASPASQLDLGGDLEETRREDRERLQPWTAGHEGVVVGQHGTGVEHVVEIDGDQRS